MLAHACFPAARRLFASVGAMFAEIDLRWGLPESASEASIVDLCTDEVVRCHGYFIGILGSRYGYVPAGSYSGQSITEIEIRKGAFDAPPSSFVRFYFKQDAVDDQPSLSALKANIRTHFAVKEYGSPQQLADLVLNDLAGLADAIAATHYKSPSETAFAWHRNQTKTIGSPAGTTVLNSFLEDKNRLLRVIGASGSGKTALLINWFSQREGARINPAPGIWRRIWQYIAHWGRPPKLRPALWLIHCAGDLTSAAGLSFMLEELVRRLRAILGETAPTNGMPLKDKLLAFHRLLGRAASMHEGILLVIDDADALFLDTILPFHWLPPSIKNVKIILSGRTSGAVAGLGNDWRSLEVTGFDQDKKIAALTGYLHQFGKHLPHELADVVRGAEYLRGPLALRIAADELRLAESQAHLMSLMKTIRETRSTVDLFSHVLGRLEREHGRAVIETICGLLACSRGGLWETEVRAILQEQITLSTAQWSSIAQAFSKSVIDHNGLYALHFDELFTAVQQRYLPNQETVAAYRHQLIRWLQTERRQTTVQQRRIIEELPWQLCQTHAWHDLMSLLVEPDFFMTSWKIDPSQVVTWWRLVEKHCAVEAPAAWNTALMRSAPNPALQATIALLYAELGNSEAAASCVMSMLNSSALGSTAPFFTGILLNLSGFLLEHGQIASAAESLRVVEACLARNENRVLLASYHNACGNLSMCNHDPTAALLSYRKAERLHTDADNQQAIAECRHNIALAMLDMNQLTDANALLTHCAATFRAVHDVELLCKTLISLAVVQEKSGKLVTSLKFAQEAETLARERQNWQLICKALRVRAHAQELSGDRDSAEQNYLECERIYELNGDRRQEIDILLARAILRVNLGTQGHQSAANLIARAILMAVDFGTNEQKTRISTIQKKIGK